MSKLVPTIIALFALSFCTHLFAQEKISVESNLDRHQVHIGDQIRYTVTITADTVLSIDSLVPGNNLGEFEIAKRLPMVVDMKAGFQVINYPFIITTFITGDFQIPSLTIGYTNSAGEKKTIATDPLPIKVVSLLAETDSAEVKPLKPQRAFSPSIPWWIYLAAGIILLAITAFVWFYKRAGKPIQLDQKEVDTRLPWEIALAELAKLRESGLIAKGAYKLFYLSLSDIFRSYIERRYGITALEQTTSEIVTAFRQRGLSTDDERIIEAFLSDCDLVKFAKFRPDEHQAESDFKRAEDFVLTTRSLPYTSTGSAGK